jgi:hypothetical protein
LHLSERKAHVRRTPQAEAAARPQSAT